jgi:hypothetical protein
MSAFAPALPGLLRRVPHAPTVACQPSAMKLASGMIQRALHHSSGLWLLAAAFVLIGLISTNAADDTKKVKKEGKTSKKVQHVVCFKFKEGTTEAQIAAMEKEFAALKGKVDGLTAFEHGRNNSPEGLNKGFTHCYIATFKNTQARDEYLPHPAHKEFVEKHLKPILEDVFVIDFGGK